MVKEIDDTATKKNNNSALAATRVGRSNEPVRGARRCVFGLVALTTSREFVLKSQRSASSAIGGHLLP
jgi:hypothetical protein